MVVVLNIVQFRRCGWFANSAGSAVYLDEFAAEKNGIEILLQNVSEDDVFYARPPTVRILLQT